ncbi:hypothetical protein ACHAWO_000656 [Cyclotella atomus]|uniref:Uncharacterized protein n=1 Tax=Cyclotella atomus TaxID=382360 RepID=A0ABD3QAZ7_9STRA
MGQAASKAATTLTKVSNRIRGNAPRKNFEYNPTRGQGPDAPKLPEKMQEMPEDLIKFLKNTGPLERTVDQDRTSPKVYESLIADEKAKDDQAKKANERVRRRMPIMGEGQANASKLDAVLGGVGAGDDKYVDFNENDDGSMTTRTTNFSTVDRSKRIESFGVNRKTLFDLSMKLNGIKSDSDEWKNLVGQEFKLLLSKDEVYKSEEQMEADLALLQDTMKYISVPVLMRDSGDANQDVIGIASDRVQDMKMSGLRLARENGLQFVVLDEDK